MKIYDYIIIGGGISGCTIAYELLAYSKDILLIDKNQDVAAEASGAAGAFLSPLLGKPNDFKDLVTKALKYSTLFYKKNFSNLIDNCGTTRIPKDNEDAKKFIEYIPYMDFEYEKKEDGYFFKIGSVVKSYEICKAMVKDIETLFNKEIKTIEYKDNIWILDNELKTKNLILATGIKTNLVDQFYINIRAVWGRRIDIKTSTKIQHNYHKACSLCKSFDDIVSIGATHHRKKQDVEDMESNHQDLLKKANDIKKLEDVQIIKDYVGARACSVDYFPMIGKIIDGDKTLKEFPYLKNGTNVKEDRFTRYNNLYIINGVGGRGFVLAPYLAKVLVEHIIDDKDIDSSLSVDRLFKRDVKRINFDGVKK